MSDVLGRLYDHLEWADRRALASLEREGDPPADALAIYAHVLGAEHVWLARLRGESPVLAVWPTLSLADCARVAAVNVAAFRALLAQLDARSLGEQVAYVNSAGQAFRSTRLEILLHVALHGMYHRGQVALLVRRSGGEPVPTDFIAFARGAPAATRPGA